MAKDAILVPRRLDELGGDVQIASPARGQVIYRGAAKWQNLPPGTSGQVLTSGGAGADPSWGAPSAGWSKVTYTANATISLAVDLHIIDATAGPVTLTVPLSSGATKPIEFIKKDASANLGKIVPTSPDTINGDTEVDLVDQWASFRLAPL